MPQPHDPVGAALAATLKSQLEFALVLTENLKKLGREVLGDEFPNVLLIRDTLKSCEQIIDSNWRDTKTV